MPPFALLLTAALAASPAAAEIVFSGFGTLGYAQSDQPYAYQRHLDDRGTLRRDSILAVQMDTHFTPEWGATVQAKLAPAEDHDKRWEPMLSWAFLSWRPDNDLLLRFGKLRIPGYLNSENLDVGVTYDYARLPIEMYSMTPANDFTGASFTKNWAAGDGEITLDGYWGKTQIEWRYYYRDGIPDLLSQGPLYRMIDLESMGLVLGYNINSNIFRLGLHHAAAKFDDGSLMSFGPVWNPIGPGVGYYEYRSDLVPGKAAANYWPVFNLGADLDLGNGVRLAGEIATRRADISTGLKATGGYLSLRKTMGHWTPYVYYAGLHTDSSMLDLYQAMNGNIVPPSIPGAETINASQRAYADSLEAYDQHTWAIGTSYALSPTSKIKAEWSRTRIGVASSLVDAPSGGDSGHQTVNVLSLSFNFVF